VLLEAQHVAGERIGGGLVVFQLDQLGQLETVGDALRNLLQAADDFFQPRPLAVQLLRPLGVVPDLGVFELAQDLGQALLLGIEVKDTSVARPPARRGLSGRGVGD
jgi:hypothetical protein